MSDTLLYRGVCSGQGYNPPASEEHRRLMTDVIWYGKYHECPGAHWYTHGGYRVMTKTIWSSHTGYDLVKLGDST